MAPPHRRIVQTERFVNEFKAIRAKHGRAKEFLSGVLFVLERDPSQGYKWGSIWCLSSVGWAGRLPVLTIFYTFNDDRVWLHSIMEVVLM